MTRTLFLHVGPAKTGTSAIQAFFKSREFDSVYYPEAGQWPDGAHHKLVFAAKGLRKYGVIDIPEWSDLKQQLYAEIAATDKDIFLSSEVCQPDFMEVVRGITSQFGLKLVVIMVYRNAIERASSVYNQDVKDPVVGLNLTPDDFLQQKANQLRIRPLFERWEREVNDIRLLPYVSDKPLLERICALLGVQTTTDDAAKVFNRSMGGHALLAMLIANKLLPSEEQRRAFFDAMRALTDFRIWTGSSYPFSREAVEILKKELQDDFDWAKAEIGAADSSTYTWRDRFVLSAEEGDKIIALLDQQGLYEDNQTMIQNLLSKFSMKD